MATDETQAYTDYSLIASGEAGGRIAAEFLAREKNPGIRNRMVVMNTNLADLRNTIDLVEGRAGIEIDLEGDQRPQGFTFGSKSGAGNDFAAGEMCADEGFDDQILNQLEASGIFADSDVFLYMTSLGGGTGNGSVPYIINRLKQNPTEGAKTVTAHVAVAAWPYDDESDWHKFNAVCGLSRLLKWYDGNQNADMVLLVDNEHVVQQADDEQGFTQHHTLINRKIRDALDLMIAAGRETYDVIDARDYIQRPSRMNAYHFAPAVATEMDTLYDLEKMFEKAADNAFVRMDPTTSRALYTIVRMPRHLIDDQGRGAKGKFTSREVGKRLKDWLDDSGYDEIEFRNTTLTPVDRAGETIDVLFLFGGFDLDPLVGDVLENHFEDNIQADESGYLDVQDYHTIRRNLEQYMDANRT